MEIFIYTIIFIIGCFFGSFFTLAVYRIPRKEDILIKHSYCPSCNHKLGFLDLFPIFSYIFLGGKCRYCKNKIRPRYFILEVFSGLTFLLYAISLKRSVIEINIVNMFFSYIYIAILFIIAGIDKENNNKKKNVLILAMVSISLVMNGGIIDRANNAVHNYQASEADEQRQIQDANQWMANYMS